MKRLAILVFCLTAGTMLCLAQSTPTQATSSAFLGHNEDLYIPANLINPYEVFGSYGDGIENEPDGDDDYDGSNRNIPLDGSANTFVVHFENNGHIGSALFKVENDPLVGSVRQYASSLRGPTDNTQDVVFTLLALDPGLSIDLSFLSMGSLSGQSTYTLPNGSTGVHEGALSPSSAWAVGQSLRFSNTHAPGVDGYNIEGFTLVGTQADPVAFQAQQVIRDRYRQFLIGESSSFTGTYGSAIAANFNSVFGSRVQAVEDFFVAFDSEWGADPAWIAYDNDRSANPNPLTPFSKFPGDTDYASEHDVYSTFLENWLPTLAYLYNTDVPGNSYHHSNQTIESESVRTLYFRSLQYLYDRGLRALGPDPVLDGGVTFHRNTSRQLNLPTPAGCANLVDMNLRMGSYCQSVFLMEPHAVDVNTSDSLDEEWIYAEAVALVEFMGILGRSSGHVEYWLPYTNLGPGETTSEFTHRIQSDSAQIYPDVNFVSALLEDDIVKIADKLQDAQNVMNDSLKIIPGWADSIKPDFTGYHHRAVYGNAYTSGFMAQTSGMVYFLKDTAYAVDAESVDNLRQLALTVRRYCQKYAMPFGIRGRFPKSTGQLEGEAFGAYVIMGSALGWDDASMAPVFERLWEPSRIGTGFVFSGGRGKITRGFYLGSMIEELDANTMIQPEPDPSGYWYHPYGGLAIHRRADWMVGVKGTSKYIWDYETGSSQNEYGQYLSHGMISLHRGDGGDAGNGYDLDNGWDWYRLPGTTYVPIGLFPQQVDEHRDFSDSTFLGGVSFDNTNGIFAMTLEDSVFVDGSPMNLKANKSVFFNDDLVLMLGSDIGARVTSLDFDFTTPGASYQAGGVTMDVGALTLGEEINDFIELSFFIEMDEAGGVPSAYDRKFVFGLSGTDDKIIAQIDVDLAGGSKLNVGEVTDDSSLVNGIELYRKPGNYSSTVSGSFNAGPSKGTYNRYTIRLWRASSGKAKYTVAGSGDGGEWETAPKTISAADMDTFQLDTVFFGLNGGHAISDMHCSISGMALMQNRQSIQFNNTWALGNNGSGVVVDAIVAGGGLPMETAILQVNLDAQTQVPMVNGQSVSTGQTTFNGEVKIGDPLGHGYYLPDASNLNVFSGTQQSYHENGVNPTQGDYITAWIDHGNVQAGGEYHAALFVNGAGVVNDPLFNAASHYVVERQDDQVHRVKFPSDAGGDDTDFKRDYVFFEATSDAGGVIAAVSEPCLITTELEGYTLSIAVVNPDLALYSETEFYGLSEIKEETVLYAESQVAPVQVTLAGQWTIDGVAEGVTLISSSATETVLEFTAKDGSTVSAVLIGSYEVVLSDDFEAGLGNWVDGGHYSGYYAGPNLYTNQTNGSLRLRKRGGSAYSSTVSDLPLGDKHELEVSFDFIVRNREQGDEFSLELSTDGGNSYSTVQTWEYTQAGLSNQVWYLGETVLIDNLTLTNQTRIRFSSNADSAIEHLYLDNVVLSAR